MNNFMRFYKLFFFVILFLSLQCKAQFSISGIVKDSISLNPLVGVSIEINQLGSSKDGISSNINYGTVTNSLGKYAITLNSGFQKVTFSYIGYQSIQNYLQWCALACKNGYKWLTFKTGIMRLCCIH